MPRKRFFLQNDRAVVGAPHLVAEHTVFEKKRKEHE